MIETLRNLIIKYEKRMDIILTECVNYCQGDSLCDNHEKKYKETKGYRDYYYTQNN